MLVYSSELTLNPNLGRKDVFDQIARWLGKRFGERGNTFIDPEKLRLGVRELRAGRDRLSAFTSSSEAAATEWMHCVQFVHPDDAVSGRTWTTEIGVYQKAGRPEVHCSFVVRTDEASTTVQAPVAVSRPRIVLQLFQNCHPSPDSPGHVVRALESDGASLFSFVAELERTERRHPIVLVSRDTVDAQTVVDAGKLRDLLVGLAQVVVVAEDADTREIERLLGRQRSAFGGAVNILFPAIQPSGFVPSFLILPQVLRDKGAEHVLACVTHRTNTPKSLSHFSASKVQTLAFRERIRNLVPSVASGDSTAALAEYRELLDDAEASLKSKDDEIGIQNELLRMQDAEIDQYKSQLFTLQTKIDSINGGPELQTAMVEAQDVLSAFASCAQSEKYV